MNVKRREHPEATIWFWADKYRIDDEKVPEESLDRVAQALASVEREPDKHRDDFVWGMNHGVIPAGRIMANAGALQKRPGSSLINCTVSGTIADAMTTESREGILDRLRDAGLTLKAGCGIGYDFTTLRPAGEPVGGSQSTTSGPIPYVESYDKVCATIRAAGERRGAQMLTFDVRHPDIEDMIDAKSQPGMLRNFNVSVLIGDDFIDAVRRGDQWPLVFPWRPSTAGVKPPQDLVWQRWPYIEEPYLVNDRGETGCRVYRTVDARELLGKIAQGAWKRGEPGLIFIDRINADNNLWWEENIRATNPCVTGETLVMTNKGAIEAQDLVGKQFTALVNGQEWESAEEGFFKTGHKAVLKLRTDGGHNLRLTPDHLVRVANLQGRTGWHEAGDLQPGDEIVIHDHEKGDRKPRFEMELRARTWPGMAVEDTHIERMRDIMKWFGMEAEIEIEDEEASLKLKVPGRAEDDTMRTARVVNVEPDGKEDVFDVQIPGINCFDANEIMVHNCGEQPLPPHGACLLGSIDLTRLVRDPMTESARIDFEALDRAAAIANRMLDNVVEIANLPLEAQREELARKRRHGLGMIGIGSALNLMQVPYDSGEGAGIAEEVAKRIAIASWKTAADLAQEKGPAPIFNETVELDQRMAKRLGKAVGTQVSTRELFVASRYLERIFREEPGIRDRLLEHGSRYTHATATAPTGTISLALADNASNGIEPTFAHDYVRNVIVDRRKTKKRVAMQSPEYRALLKRSGEIPEEGLHLVGGERPEAQEAGQTSADVSTHGHRRMQARVQRWTDAGVSKTVNVPREATPESIAELYQTAFEDSDIKGLTCFRFDPVDLAGVLVTREDLAGTRYEIETKSHKRYEVGGLDTVWYDGQLHEAQNLHDAIKEGMYGRYSTPPFETDPEDGATIVIKETISSVKARIGVGSEELERMHEEVKRPAALAGTTYKIPSSTASEHAVYVTINDYVLNNGTANERKVPFEIFINSKDMQQYQWTVALTRVVSAVFRKGGDVTFLHEELQSVFDPGGGYRRGRDRVPSLVAEIGMIVQQHLEAIGAAPTDNDVVTITTGDMEDATVCPKCQRRAMIRQSGCLSCQNCGHTKCE